jgi:hypothetical protein
VFGLFGPATILLPFDCFLGALESRACGLLDLVPPARELLEPLRDVLQFVRTDSVRQIFHELHIRLLSWLVVNNRDEALAGSSLALKGRPKIRDSRGESTCDANEPMLNPYLQLKSVMTGCWIVTPRCNPLSIRVRIQTRFLCLRESVHRIIARGLLPMKRVARTRMMLSTPLWRRHLQHIRPC